LVRDDSAALLLRFIDVNTGIEYLYDLGCEGSQLYFVSC